MIANDLAENTEKLISVTRAFPQRGKFSNEYI